MRYKKQLGRALIYLFCIAGTFIALFPIYWMLINAFKPSTEIPVSYTHLTLPTKREV